MPNTTYFKIGNVDFSKLISYKVGDYKLWAEGSGRNLAGSNKARLVGIFTKLELQTGSMNETEMQSFLNAVNVANADVTYFDSQTKALKTESFYFGDIVAEIKKIKYENGAYKVKYKPLSFSVIANDPRS